MNILLAIAFFITDSIPVENPGHYSSEMYLKRNEPTAIWFKDAVRSADNGVILDSVWTMRPYNYDTLWCKEIIFWDELNDKVTPVRRMEVNFMTKGRYPSQYFNDRTDIIYFIEGQTAVNVIWYKNMQDSWIRVKNIY